MNKKIEYFEESVKRHIEMANNVLNNQADKLVQIADMISDSLRNDRCVFVCGNGGSAADAQHIVGELVGRFAGDRRGLAAVALSTDTSVMTSIANDFGFDEVFSRQIEGLAKKGDVLWALSTSGNSANIIKAVQIAKQKGVRIIGFTGKQKSLLEQLSDLCFCAPAKTSFRSQEIHQLAYHIICGLVDNEFCNNN